MDMDIKKVYMVRSAKGVDMLCVDDYLYHYDGRGRYNTFRWLCNRRKDKRTPCRSRISTIIPNPRDKSVHVVQEVHMEHSHDRCSNHEITKVSERKRIANLQGQPCSLDLERAARHESPLKKIRLDSDSGGEEITILPENLDLSDRHRVYVLRRRDGRIMCCVDGQLYYLDGKSMKMELYRWMCVRKRDVSCTAYIYTEPTIDRTHRLRSNDSDAHIHPHYSPDKLMHMFRRHNISLVDDDQIQEILDDNELEFFDHDVLDEEHTETIENTQLDDEESIIIEDYSDLADYELIVNNDVEDKITNICTDTTVAEPYWPLGHDVIENFVPPTDHNPLTESDFRRFTFLPSAKGKKVLCLDRHLYHYDSQSKANGLMFWTCIMRRVKRINCHVRVTMDPTRETPTIIRIVGEHNHEINLKDIEKRMRRQVRDKQEQEEKQYKKSTDIFESENSLDIDDSSHAEESMEDEKLPTVAVETKVKQEEQQKQLHQQVGVVMKKVIDIDGIKLEPKEETFAKMVTRQQQQRQQHQQQQPKQEEEQQQQLNKPAAMIVEYLNDGADNISAKIEILPTALQELSDAAASIANPTTAAAPILAINSSGATRTKPTAEDTRRRKITQMTSSSTQEEYTIMDLSKICKLRSAKGSELLCVDGYIYHSKNKGLISRSYWVCIKARDHNINCKSRISTAIQKDGSIRVLRVYNGHSHPVNEDDIKRRLYNEINKKSAKKLKFTPLHFVEKSLDEIRAEYGDLAIERLRVTNLRNDVIVHKPPRTTTCNKYGRRRNRTNNNNDDSNKNNSSINTRTSSNINNSKSTNVTTDDDEDDDEDDESQHSEFADNKGQTQIVQNTNLMEQEQQEQSQIVVEQTVQESNTYAAKHEMHQTHQEIAEYLINEQHQHLEKQRRDYLIKKEEEQQQLQLQQQQQEIAEYLVNAQHQHHEQQHQQQQQQQEIAEYIVTEQTPTDQIFEIEQQVITEYVDTVIPLVDSIIEEVTDVVEYDTILDPIYTMKLYAVSDGPPSLAVRMTLRALNIQYQLINMDFCNLEHRTEEFGKMNPQKELPVLDDEGFFLSESVAIMQYLCDKYAPNSSLYPHDPNIRAIINQRLCFNLCFYYARISEHSMAPIFFDYQRTPMSLKKVENALEVLETYLQRSTGKYVAGDNLTIADFGLISATICLEAINFDLSKYTLITQWYETFKVEYAILWEIANAGMQEIHAFELNPPDLSHIEHPFHPVRKVIKNA